MTRNADGREALLFSLAAEAEQEDGGGAGTVK
jgi:hypothetical protein